MILTADSLAYYLLERGLISTASAVDGDLLIVDSTSRNRNFKVIRKHQPGYFVKQIQPADPQAGGFLQREASCYWRASHDPDFSSLAPLVPAFHLYDSRRQILVVELLQSGANLAEYHRRLGVFPLPVAARIGELLATYHSISLSTVEISSATPFPRTVPWILSAHQLAGSPLQTIGGANTQILSLIHRYSDFHGHLDALREQWRFDCFIHGDMKWENCIVSAHAGDMQVKLIDWETADVGDAAWDVGAIFQAYLTFWIMSIPIRSDASLDQLLELAPYPIEAMQPAIRAFWMAYAERRQLAAGQRRELLTRSAGYAAARMLQTAYEYMYYSPQVTLNALALLQVSLNILADPSSAVSELLSL